MHKNHLHLGAAMTVLAVALAAGGCAFLLDTDSLQEGSGAPEGGGGAAGATGTGGGAGTGGGSIDAGRPCSDDRSCQEMPGDDPCTKDWCDRTESVCRRVPHSGLALRADADEPEELVGGLAEVGLPVMTTDAANNFYLGFLTRETAGGDGDLRLVRMANNPGAAIVSVRLAQVSATLTAAYSSPGLQIVANRLRVAVAAKRQVTGQTESGMYRFQLDKDTLAPPSAGAGADQTLLKKDDGYALFPATATMPRIARHAGSDIVFWVFEGELYTSEWSVGGASSVSFSFVDVTHVLPITGSVGFKLGAVLEAEDGLYVWTQGNNNLTVKLDSGSGTRLGLSGAAIQPKSLTAPTVNAVYWARHQAPNLPAMKLGGAVCDANRCTANNLGVDVGDAPGGLWPSIAIEAPEVTGDQRRIVTAHGVIAESGGEPTTGLLLNAYEVDITKLDQKLSVEDLVINPPTVFVTAPEAIADTNPSNSPYGPTAVATTRDGKIALAWVQRDGAGLSSLRMKRYSLGQCAR